MKSGKFMARGLVTERIFSLVYLMENYALFPVYDTCNADVASDGKTY
jgi:hypothetical protein